MGATVYDGFMQVCKLGTVSLFSSMTIGIHCVTFLARAFDNFSRYGIGLSHSVFTAYLGKFRFNVFKCTQEGVLKFDQNTSLPWCKGKTCPAGLFTGLNKLSEKF